MSTGLSGEGSLRSSFGESAAACAGGSIGTRAGGPDCRSAGRSVAAAAGVPAIDPVPWPRPPRKRARSTAARTCSPVITSRPSCSRRTAKATLRPSTPLTRAWTSTGRPAKAGPVWSTATRVPTPASPDSRYGTIRSPQVASIQRIMATVATASTPALPTAAALSREAGWKRFVVAMPCGTMRISSCEALMGRPMHEGRAPGRRPQPLPRPAVCRKVCASPREGRNG